MEEQSRQEGFISGWKVVLVSSFFFFLPFCASATWYHTAGNWPKTFAHRYTHKHRQLFYWRCPLWSLAIGDQSCPVYIVFPHGVGVRLPLAHLAPLFTHPSAPTCVCFPPYLNQWRCELALLVIARSLRVSYVVQCLACPPSRFSAPKTNF